MWHWTKYDTEKVQQLFLFEKDNFIRIDEITRNKTWHLAWYWQWFSSKVFIENISADISTVLADTVWSKSSHGNVKTYLGLSKIYKMERLMKVVFSKKDPA